MDAFKPALHRKFFIDQKIRNKTYPNASSLARDYLAECGKYVNPRTIAADIAALRDELSAPIRYDAEKRGYVYTNPSFTLNFLNNQPADLKNLFVSPREPDKNALDNHYESALIDTAGRHDPLAGRVSVLRAGETHGEVPPAAALLYAAVARAGELVVEYHKTEYKNTYTCLRFIFHPLHLLYVEGVSFVFGAVQALPAMPYAILNLSHIKKIEPAALDFPRPEYVGVEAADNGDIKVYISKNQIDTLLVFTRLNENTGYEWTLHSRTDVFFRKLAI
jgi:hypothetical protein